MKTLEGQLVAEGFKFAFLVARFNEFLTESLLQGGINSFLRHGGKVENTTIVKVPGAFEIPLAAKRLAESKQYDAIVCLGAVIRGATPHFDYVCSESARGIMTVSLTEHLPIVNGILTTDNEEQAFERSGDGVSNKGYQVTMGLVDLVSVMRRLDD